MNDKNIFDEITENRNSVSKNVRKTLNDYLVFILLFVNIAFRIILQLYDPRFVNPFSVAFVLDTMTSLISTMFCYIVFIPQGTANEKQNSVSYKPNLIKWGELSSVIRTGGLLASFRDYCKEQVEKEREAVREAIISNNTSFTYKEFTTYYSTLNKSELKILRNSGKITRGEYRAIKKATGNIHIKPVNSVLILAGVAKTNYNDAGRDNENYAAKWLLRRPMVILLCSILSNALSGSFVGLSGLSVIYSMVIDILFIIVAAFIGYGVGTQSVQAENDKIKNRILFIETFLESAK